MAKVNREKLEELYFAYNRREYVHPDPLEFLYLYSDSKDREIVGMVSASLAFGRVAQILASIRNVLDRIGNPTEFVTNNSLNVMKEKFGGFRHRWATGDEMASMLYGIGRVMESRGSLQKSFLSYFSKSDETVHKALGGMINEVSSYCGVNFSSLLSVPSRGSACKRLYLFLRWMVREDDVDPGGWDSVPREKLLIPLDTHMYRICTGFGMTSRKSADLKTSMEITSAFREINPADPVKYDFALTRFGIRSELDSSEMVSECVSV